MQCTFKPDNIPSVLSPGKSLIEQNTSKGLARCDFSSLRSTWGMFRGSRAPQEMADRKVYPTVQSERQGCQQNIRTRCNKATGFLTMTSGQKIHRRQTELHFCLSNQWRGLTQKDQRSRQRKTD